MVLTTFRWPCRSPSGQSESEGRCIIVGNGCVRLAGDLQTGARGRGPSPGLIDVAGLLSLMMKLTMMMKLRMGFRRRHHCVVSVLMTMTMTIAEAEAIVTVVVVAAAVVAV